MTKRTRYGITLGFALLAMLVSLMVHFAERNEKFERIFPIMGTVAKFTFYGTHSSVREAAERAFAVFERVEKLCNLYDSESELSRLNAKAAEGPFVCSSELWYLLLEARKAYLFSNGAFDITTKPLMDLWGFYRKRGDSPPSQREVAEARRKVGLDKATFDASARSVRFTVPGMSFDLGGIAKGYAVDLAAEEAGKAGIQRGVIDLGGNLRLLPQPPPGRDFYQIGIRNPQKHGAVLNDVLKLRGVSLSTSGNYERFSTIGGMRYGHIMNPRNGFPTQDDGSVTVIAPSALLADWLSTAIFLEGETLAERAKSSFKGVSVIIVRTEPKKR